MHAVCADPSNSLVSRDVFSGLCNVLQVVWPDNSRDWIPLTLHGFLRVSNVFGFFVNAQEPSVPLGIPALTSQQSHMYSTLRSYPRVKFDHAVIPNTEPAQALIHLLDHERTHHRFMGLVMKQTQCVFIFQMC